MKLLRTTNNEFCQLYVLVLCQLSEQQHHYHMALQELSVSIICFEVSVTSPEDGCRVFLKCCVVLFVMTVQKS